MNLRPTAVASCLVLCGCGGAIDPAPFEGYATATRQLGEGMDAVFAVDRTWSREVFAERLAENDVDSLELAVVFPDDPEAFDAEMPEPPLFIVVGDAAREMRRLTDGALAYAEMLAALASGEITTPARLDALAHELNANATGLAGALAARGVDVPASFDGGAALVSAAATEAFGAHVRERRRETLARAIETNQPTVETWVDVAHEALESVRDDVQATYTSRKRTLLTVLAEGSASQRRRAAEDLADLQAAVVDVVRTLAELREGYASMSAAHAELATALTSERPALTALAELYRYAARVAELDEALGAARPAAIARDAPVRATGDRLREAGP